jgi:hypothetical protein
MSRAFLQSTHVWTDRWVAPYESGFSLLHKFAWANPGLRTSRIQDRELQAMIRWRFRLNVRRRSASNSLRVFGQELLDARARGWIDVLEGSRLRFCFACMARGFHSIFQQIEAVCTCPVHGEPLRNQCEHCGSATPLLQPVIELPEEPFLCTHCSRPLAGAIEPSAWSFTSEEREELSGSLKPIADWLQVLGDRMAPPHTLAAPLSQLSVAGPYAQESEQLVAFAIAQRIAPWSHHRAKTIAARRPVQVVRVRSHLNDRCAEPGEWKNRRRSIAKAIRRKLLRSLLHRHRQCVRAAFMNIALNQSSYGALIIQSDSACPLAAAYVRWFRSQECLGTFRASLNSTQNSSLEEPPPSWDSALTCWAWSTLADFYSHAATTIALEHCLQRGLTAEAIWTDLGNFCRADAENSCWVIPPNMDNGESHATVVLGNLRVIDHLSEVANQSCRVQRRGHPSARSQRKKPAD